MKININSNTQVLDKVAIKKHALEICKKAIPSWQSFSFEDFDFDDPKGFSSFTMGIRNKLDARPNAVLFRKLEGKENAILSFETEKETFLSLGAHQIAANCLFYDGYCRIEAFYDGRTLEKEDLFEPEVLKGIADQLYKFHKITPQNLPKDNFFQLLFNKWGELAKDVLENNINHFPAEEQKMAIELREIYSPKTWKTIESLLPNSPISFCHNDTYHGNIMKLNNGEIKLLDFEFSCLNFKAYDFSNLYAETVMQHKLPDYPYFRINEPAYSEKEINMLISFYLDNQDWKSQNAREAEHTRLYNEVLVLLKMSDFKYALASIPLSMEPIQKIRFIPYAHQRWQKFLGAV